jgi:hypothetical protein
MGLLGTLLGRRKRTAVSWDDALDAMALLASKLQNELETITTGQVGLIVRPAKSPPSDGIAAEIEDALSDRVTNVGVRYHIQTDEQYHVWVVIEAEELELLVHSLRRITEALRERGLGDRVLAAVFPFTWMGQSLYWICPIKTGRYTPFATTGAAEDRLRDYPLELRMETALRKDLPTERDVSLWYPLWGMPI